MRSQTFKTTVTKVGSKSIIALPFDPNVVWGEKTRHHIHGTINGCAIRGPLDVDGKQYFLALGDAWLRDNDIEVEGEVGAEVEVMLQPEGPQSDSLPADIAIPLADADEAQAFFDALPTFYRKNFMRWIESAKRPATRAARISEMVELLKAGKRER